MTGINNQAGNQEINFQLAKIVQDLDNSIEKISNRLAGIFIALVAVLLYFVYGVQDTPFWKGLILSIVIGFILMVIVGFFITSSENSHAKKAAKKIDTQFPYGSPERQEAIQFLTTMQETKNNALEKLSQYLTDVAFNLNPTAAQPAEKVAGQKPTVQAKPAPPAADPKDHKYIPLEVDED
jgi:ABC-type multidrug transport system fused ATPase/permease subunit